MKKLLGLAVFMCVSWSLVGQSFEVIGLQERYHGIIGQTVKAPLQFRNKSEKPVLLTLRRLSNDLGSTQKNLICLNDNCQDYRTEEFNFKLERGQTFNTLALGIEAGLVQTESSVRYVIFNRALPTELFEFELRFSVTDQPEKAAIYNSRQFILHDVYPNPVTDFAVIDYQIFDEKLDASVRLHNILGNTIDEYPLPVSEGKVKIRAELLDPGIYFYTVYLDNEAVVTRKLIIKK